MAKDPAFLFYDADAARDVSHMNRLERGCYFDVIQAQKKFGKLSYSTIKKILGKDFEECWSNLNLVLTNTDDMYCISWLQESIKKREEYSDSRKRNRNSTKSIDNIQLSSTHDETYNNTHVPHMVNEIVNINIKEKECFENARKLYPGTKRGLNTEFDNFRKKHKDWIPISIILEEKIKNQISARKVKVNNREFVPEWKNFATWINQRCWEDEIGKTQETKPEVKSISSMEEYDKLFGG